MEDNGFTGESADRAMVFIDGNNLYHGLRGLGWPTAIAIGAFAQRIVGDRQLVSAYYYNARPPAGSSHEEIGNAFLVQLTGAPNLYFRESRLQAIQKHGEDGPYQSYTEKGADTALTTDLLSYVEYFDVALIVSSDGDFEPPARRLTELGKLVEVLYFRGRRPFVMESVSRMREIRRSFFVELDWQRPRRFGSKSGTRRARRYAGQSA